jgi:hypothetical protein
MSKKSTRESRHDCRIHSKGDYQTKKIKYIKTYIRRRSIIFVSLSLFLLVLFSYSGDVFLLLGCFSQEGRAEGKKFFV